MVFLFFDGNLNYFFPFFLSRYFCFLLSMDLTAILKTSKLNFDDSKTSVILSFTKDANHLFYSSIDIFKLEILNIKEKVITLIFF